MNKKQIKELRDRWTKDIELDINRSFADRWFYQQDKCFKDFDLGIDEMEVGKIPQKEGLDSPFGLTEQGYIDFRGFPFRAGFVYQTLINVDFSYAREIIDIDTPGHEYSNGGGFLFCILENCLFIGAEMPYRLEEKFINCDFSGATFKSSEFGPVFDSCLFIKSKIIDGRCAGASFLNCNFTEANLLKSNFNPSYFENCIFDNTKFTKAFFAGSTFVNTRPSDEQLAACFSYGGEVIGSEDIKFK